MTRVSGCPGFGGGAQSLAIVAMTVSWVQRVEESLAKPQRPQSKSRGRCHAARSSAARRRRPGGGRRWAGKDPQRQAARERPAACLWRILVGPSRAKRGPGQFPEELVSLRFFAPLRERV